jgi:23S rRNA (pseudouridine1915-N3)-methyltransferase
VIKFIAVGKLKEKYWKDAFQEYSKRLTKYSKVELVEIDEEKIAVENDSMMKISKDKEGERILKKISSNDYVILFDVQGNHLDSVELAKKIQGLIDKGHANLCFVLGGSYGFSDLVYERAQAKISMSKMTFPHQFARIMAIEQVYRAYKINNNEKYHK